MKKICITLLLLTTVQMSVFAYERFNGEAILKKIDDAYIKANPKKMEKLWNEFCGINAIACEANYSKYNEMLFDAKVRQQEKRQQMWSNIAAGAAAGAAVGSAAASQRTTQQVPVYAPAPCIGNNCVDVRVHYY